jgi:hypothetical protein
MTVLQFSHHGRRVATAAWTAAEDTAGRVELAYLAHDRSGTRRISLTMSFPHFMARLSGSTAAGIIDLDECVMSQDVPLSLQPPVRKDAAE